MTGVASRLEQIRGQGRAALVGYLPAGFPSYDGSIAALTAMVEAGVDVVEVGLPYSDPVMDGPTVQAAAEQALAAGTRTSHVLDTVSAVADTGVPVLVMTYWNPIERYGVDAFARDLANAGGAGLITPDLIPDEAAEWITAADEHELDKVFLVAPSSTDERLTLTAQACRGFLYATSVMGVTGARDHSSVLAPVLAARIRARTDVLLGVGLGVSTRAQAAEIAAYADAVIVGSAFVRTLLDEPVLDAGVRAAAALAGELAEGVRR